MTMESEMMSETKHTTPSTIPTEEQHTKEPWTFMSLNQTDCAVIGPKRERKVATVHRYSKAENAANARRIVAAVNATADLSTEALEQGVVAELVEACHESVSQVCWIAEQLQAQGQGEFANEIWEITESLEDTLAKVRPAQEETA